MNILGSIDKFLSVLPRGVIDENILYIELGKDNYELLEKEVSNLQHVIEDVKLEGKQVINDIGNRCSTLSYLGYKVIIVQNEDKKLDGKFYIAFKIKVL
jgi:hypothetical protein